MIKLFPVQRCLVTLKTIMAASESLMHVSVWTKQDIIAWQDTSTRAGNQTKPQTVMRQSTHTKAHPRTNICYPSSAWSRL